MASSLYEYFKNNKGKHEYNDAYNRSCEEDKKEYFDKEDVLTQKTQELAKLIQTSKHCVILTGAGISTSSGIKDFRSGVGTVLKTGPGAWEIKATGSTKKPASTTPIMRAMPTYTHMAIAALAKAGLVKFVVTQNFDSLHRKSGLDPSKLATIHGDRCIEICKKCKRRYLRDFTVRTAMFVHDHKTGRFCVDCGNELEDTLVNFDEEAVEEDYAQSITNCKMADLIIVIGSSLLISTATSLVEMALQNKAAFVIINLQNTPMNKLASMVIHGISDTCVSKLMNNFDIKIPKFRLIRKIKVDKLKKGKSLCLSFSGIDFDGRCYSFIKKVVVEEEKGKRSMLEREPFIMKSDVAFPPEIKALILFYGSYNEPPYKITVDTTKPTQTVSIEYSFKAQKWNLYDEK